MAIEELQNGRYKRIRLIGSGGMGEVHLMEDTRIQRQVAIKVMRSEVTTYPENEKTGNAARLFQREARAIAALEHPNILPLYDFGEEVVEEMTITYMVMPYCQDGTMATWFKQRGENETLSPKDIAYFISEAADALQYAHDQKIIHLDVKPSNFLLRANRKDPRRPTLLLADFGISRSFTTISSSSRTIRGTPTAMAPEQWSGDPVAATDQYALAIMAYEMLAGRPPFVGSMEQLMYRHFAVPADPPSKFNPRIPTEIDKVLGRALMKKPEERFPNISSFADALEEALSGLNTEDLALTEMQTIISDGLVTPELSVDEDEEVGLSQMITLGKDEKASAPVAEESRTARKAEETPVLEETPRLNQRANPAEVLVLADTSQSAERVRPDQQTDPARYGAEERHNQPTLSTTAPVTVGKLANRERRSRGVSPATVLSGVAVVIVLIAAFFAASAYFRQNNGSAQAGSNKPAQAISTAAATPTVGVTPTATPTPTPGMYINGTYNGSITTDNGGTRTLKIVIIQKQGEGALQGNAIFNNSETDALHGQVDQQGNFKIWVNQNGQTSLFLAGTMNQQGSDLYMHGNVCNSTDDTCPTGTNGYFNVGPRY